MLHLVFRFKVTEDITFLGIANPGYTTEPEAPPPYHPTNNQYSNYPGQPPQHPVTEGP